MKFRYALDSRNNLIDVFKLNRETLDRAEQFLTIDTNQELVPKIADKVRGKHFALKNKNEYKGSLETYLHVLAKKFSLIIITPV